MNIRKFVAVLAIAGAYLLAAPSCGYGTPSYGPPPHTDGGTDGGTSPPPMPPGPYENSPGSNQR